MSILGVILLTACGGGGGASTSNSVTTPTPTPTPPPTTYSFNGDFYTSKSITSFSACIDFNFNMTCDSNDLKTSNYSSNSQTNYSFTISTQNVSERNQIDENLYFLVIEINKNTDDYLKLMHPGFKYSELIGVNINVNAFSTAFTLNNNRPNFPSPFYYEDSNQSYFDFNQDQVLDILDRNIYRIRNTDGLEVNEFFGELSNNSCCLTEERANIYESLVSHGSILEQRLVSDMLDIAQIDGANFFGVPTAGKTPRTSADVTPFSHTLRVFNSSNFPNDTTGAYTTLDSTDRLTLPFFVSTDISYDNFVNGWKGSLLFESYPGITEYLGEPYLSKREAECDINPAYTCRSTFSLQNLLTTTPYQREIYRVSSKTSDGNYDSFVDNYRLVNNGGGPECSNWEAAERTTANSNFIELRRIENEFSSYWDGQSCVLSGATFWVYQYAERDYLDTKSTLYVTFASNNCCSDGYFVNMPYDVYQDAQNIFNNSSSITGELNNYLNGIRSDLSILGDLVSRLKNQNTSDYHYASVLFYPYPWSNTRNELYIDQSGGSISLDCTVNGDILLAYSFATDQQIDEVIDECIPYLTNGFNFGSESIPSPSPFVGGDTTLINNSSSYQLSREYRIDSVRQKNLRQN
tara:strand:+ start:105 stop:2006 length:1902 start_codon:yes stop_codon:yes gene_type:complete